MREIETQKIGSNVMNLHIKRQRITVNLRISSRKMAISQSNKGKMADKKVAYNEGCLYKIDHVLFGLINIHSLIFISKINQHKS